jgi:hypothetical protein
MTDLPVIYPRGKMASYGRSIIEGVPKEAISFKNFINHPDNKEAISQYASDCNYHFFADISEIPDVNDQNILPFVALFVGALSSFTENGTLIIGAKRGKICVTMISNSSIKATEKKDYINYSNNGVNIFTYGRYKFESPDKKIVSYSIHGTARQVLEHPLWTKLKKVSKDFLESRESQILKEATMLGANYKTVTIPKTIVLSQSNFPPLPSSSPIPQSIISDIPTGLTYSSVTQNKIPIFSVQEKPVQELSVPPLLLIKDADEEITYSSSISVVKSNESLKKKVSNNNIQDIFKQKMLEIETMRILDKKKIDEKYDHIIEELSNQFEKAKSEALSFMFKAVEKMNFPKEHISSSFSAPTIISPKNKFRPDSSMSESERVKPWESFEEYEDEEVLIGKNPSSSFP